MDVGLQYLGEIEIMINIKNCATCRERGFGTLICMEYPKGIPVHISVCPSWQLSGYVSCEDRRTLIERDYNSLRLEVCHEGN